LQFNLVFTHSNCGSHNLEVAKPQESSSKRHPPSSHAKNTEEWTVDHEKPSALGTPPKQTPTPEQYIIRIMPI